MESYSQKTFKREKEAAEISLDRLRRSIEGALEKEKQCVEKEAVNQYIRDASRRMSLNLPIKPVREHRPHKDKLRSYGEYRLPSLHHRDHVPIKKPDERIPNTDETADEVVNDEELPLFSQYKIRLPPIIIDTGQSESNSGKRKRKQDDKDNQPDRKSPKQHKNTAKKALDSGSCCDEELSVVMCGRSPAMQETHNELYVSKHGRFKSK